jgi:hypothetical protein
MMTDSIPLARATRTHWPRSDPADRMTTLCSMLEPFGGAVDDSKILESLRCCCSQPLSVLARWIADRQVLHLPWGAATYFPCFQFVSDGHQGTYAPLPGMRGALVELDGVFDDMEIVEWFARPNDWLGRRAPAAVVTADADWVIGAARADRYIASGW